MIPLMEFSFTITSIFPKFQMKNLGAPTFSRHLCSNCFSLSPFCSIHGSKGRPKKSWTISIQISPLKPWFSKHVFVHISIKNRLCIYPYIGNKKVQVYWNEQIGFSLYWFLFLKSKWFWPNEKKRRRKDWEEQERAASLDGRITCVQTSNATSSP